MSALVINLFGEPGAGKSTAAAYIFSQLKISGINTEYVSEFAKDKVYEDNAAVFKNQAYIFGKQYFKMSRVSDKVDVIVTDSPLLLSAIYNDSEILGKSFEQTVLNVFNSFDNYNIVLSRKHDYKNEGRLQNREEAVLIRNKLIHFLYDNQIRYEPYPAVITAYDCIVDRFLSSIEKGSIE